MVWICHVDNRKLSKAFLAFENFARVTDGDLALSCHANGARGRIGAVSARFQHWKTVFGYKFSIAIKGEISGSGKTNSLGCRNFKKSPALDSQVHSIAG